MFLGFISLESTLHAGLQTTSSDEPLDADALPNFRVYSPSGLLPLGGGQAALMESGTITGATNANPIVITSAGHGLTSGMKVKISGVGGNTAANTTAVVTKIDTNTFSIPVAGNGAYTSGGTWHVAGLYDLPIAATGANGFVAGAMYTLLATWLMGAAAQSETFSFGVV